ncbi:hypothetical protein Tco_1395495 [Tanacetum coccineum]
MMVVNTIDVVTSVLTQKELDLFCSTYNIPADLHSKLPGRDDTIQTSPEGKIGIYTRFIEFANFRIPLSKFLLCILQYYLNNFSQLSVLAAAKISHFEIMYHVLGHQPSLGRFRRFYVNSYSNGWLSFSKRVPFPSCVSKNLDSLKNWNDHFSGLTNLFVLSLLHDMGLLDFVKFTDPFKLKTRERTLADGEVPLLTESAYMVVAPSNQTVHLVSHTIADKIKDHAGKKRRKVGLSADELSVKKVRSGGVVISKPNPTTAGKSSAALRRLELQSGQPDVGVGSVHHPTEEFVSSFVTPTPEPEGYEDSGLPHDGSVRTRRASERYVVLTSSSEHGDTNVMRVEDVDVSLVNEIVNSSLLENDVDVASLPRNRAGTSSLPGNRVGTSSSVPNDGSPVDDFYESQTIDSSKS